MAADLASTPASGIRVQVCGDAHLSHFGGFATPERHVIFDINDFDETLPGPWEGDLGRLVASVVLAGRHIRLAESETARAVAATARFYREHMADYAAMRALDVWYDAIDVDRFLEEMETDKIRKRVAARLRKVREKNAPEFLFRKLAERRGAAPTIADDPPLIFHPTAEIAPGVRTRYRDGFASYRDSLAEHVGALFDRFHFCDLALKVVGVGSVGTQCAIALLMASEDDPIFLQIEEAHASVLEPHIGKREHAHHGERVVVGQRLMQSVGDPFLCCDRGANGRDFDGRQLRDMETGAIIEGFEAGDLGAYGRVCGWALARAHARSSDAALIAGYMGSSEIFDDAMGDFAAEYAEHDHRAFVMAVRQDRIKPLLET
jgi:uncharacterized protein (DUF2252 family)